MATLQERLSSLKGQDGPGRPLYERVAEEITSAIERGDLRPGDRLPAVRSLATDIGLSVTTVMAVYSRLGESGLVRGEAGRGTFVCGPSHVEGRGPDRPGSAATAGASRAAGQADAARLGLHSAWRRASLARVEARLKAAHPDAIDLMRGGPDAGLLPLAEIRRAYKEAAASLSRFDMEYPSGLQVEASLASALLPRLQADGIVARADELLVGSSAQQFLGLLGPILARRPIDNARLVAVEEPGYQTAMDTLETCGLTLVGIPGDEQGATVQGLKAALEAGATTVLLTPRGHSPTGTSLTKTRRGELADVLAEQAKVVVVEDDHFAEAAASRPGSLFADDRLRSRSVYIRSFSKSISPDMRIAVALVGGELRHDMTLSKSFADGWTSRFTQRVLGAVLADSRTDEVLDRARKTYADRRSRTMDALRSGCDPSLVEVMPVGPDGLHVWLRLPPGAHSAQAAEVLARRGVLVAPGQPFFLRPGDQRHLRVNAGALSLDRIPLVLSALRDACEELLGSPEDFLTP